MSNPKRHPQGFAPRNLGMQSKGFNGNNGKKMQTKEGQAPTQAPKN